MRWATSALVLGFALGAACNHTANPAAPPTNSIEQPAGGATLKIDPPVLSQPSNGVKIGTGDGLALRLKNVQGTFETFPVTYEFEIRNPAGELLIAPKVPENSSGVTSFIAPDSLDASLPGGVPLSWRARATSQDLVGPWSQTRTFTASQGVNVSGPSQYDVASAVQLKAEYLQLSTRTDCTPRAKWSVDDPTVATVTNSGVVTLLKFGQFNVTATCDGVVSLPSRGISAEIWYGQFQFSDCAKLIPATYCYGVGTFDPGKSHDFRLIVQETDGFHVSGLLKDLTGLTTTFSGTISSQGEISIDGKTFSADCGADNGPRSTTFELHVTNGRLTWHVIQSDWFADHRGGCLPDSRPTNEWLISGTVGNLHR